MIVVIEINIRLFVFLPFNLGIERITLSVYAKLMIKSLKDDNLFNLVFKI